jgi:hypothetical protein
MSPAHWEVVQLPGEPTPLAAIVDSTETVQISLGCGGNVLLAMGPDKGLNLPHPSLKLSWDAEVSADTGLEAFSSGGTWVFGADRDQAAFWPTIGRLKRHRILEATVSDVSIAPLHYRFSLADADQAIDYVLAQCGVSNPVQ